jgi:hypothetical protein
MRSNIRPISDDLFEAVTVPDSLTVDIDRADRELDVSTGHHGHGTNVTVVDGSRSALGARERNACTRVLTEDEA